MTDPAISPLVAADLPDAVRLLERAGLASGAANVGRYLAWQPDGAWQLRREGGLVGMVTLLRFGHVGFVGCMAVEPTLHGGGIGRALLEHAHAEGRAAGVRTFLLEATDAGAHLYRRLGYETEHETVIVARTIEAASTTERIGAARAEIVALDTEAAASPRGVMIGALVQSYEGAIVRDARGLAGYGLVVGERLGPIVARDPGAGRELVARLAGATKVATVAVPNTAACEALAAAGFTVARRLERMRLGPPIGDRHEWIFALASAGAG
ncbi:MAG TPA: GNAT family N-acetyltransferase [Kofleriaceae bacterium]|jgi:ribosomal protein S18 acetylase RimI-like enzyme